MTVVLRAGFGRAAITPQLGSPMAGYLARVKGAQGVHDQLSAHAAVFEQGPLRAAVLNLDLLEVTEEICREIRRRAEGALGIPGDNLLICATHTHSGPAVSKKFGFDGNESTVDRIISGAVLALEEAQGKFQAVEVKRGRAALAGVAKNRRTLEETPDPAVQAVGFYAGAELVGCLVNFGLHPTVLGAENLEYSADYPGFLRRAVARQHPGCCTLVLTGAAGNVNIGYSADASALGEQIDFRTFTKAEEVGTTIAQAALNALGDGVSCTEPFLQVVSGRVPLPLKHLPTLDELGLSLAELRERRQALPPESSEAKQLSIEEVYLTVLQASLEDYKAEGRSELDVPLQALAVGDTVLVGIPGEPFAELGLSIKEGWEPAQVLVVAYANGYFGYFPTMEAFQEGGYEAETSVFHPSAIQVLTTEARRLIAAVLGKLGLG
ncbi:neutral/alkaline non-lysosomal ceramidase N-terminal domain-containing protein [Candidatus Darwinibacter acetoxidans]